MHSACDESREEYGMRRLLVALIATTVFGKGSVSSFIIFTVIRLVTIHMLMLKQRSDGLIPRPEDSYRLWCVVVCDQETSKRRRLKPATGL